MIVSASVIHSPSTVSISSKFICHLVRIVFQGDANLWLKWGIESLRILNNRRFLQRNVVVRWVVRKPMLGVPVHSPRKRVSVPGKYRCVASEFIHTGMNQFYPFEPMQRRRSLLRPVLFPKLRHSSN